MRRFIIIQSANDTFISITTAINPILISNHNHHCRAHAYTSTLHTGGRRVVDVSVHTQRVISRKKTSVRHWRDNLGFKLGTVLMAILLPIMRPERARRCLAKFELVVNSQKRSQKSKQKGKKMTIQMKSNHRCLSCAEADGYDGPAPAHEYQPNPYGL